MQPITLNQIGQFAIIQSNEPLVNISAINNFYDEITGIGQIIKEFSWSRDNLTWSYWTILNQENLLSLSSKELLPEEGFYFRVRYTLATIGSITITDVGINTEEKIIDKNKGYIPYGYKIGSMNCVECGSMRGQILSKCNPSFNPYLVNPAIDIYKDLLYGVQNMFGLDVMYMRAKPKENSGDVVFKEWTLYSVEEGVCTKVLVPDNEFPDPTLDYNPYGIEYEAPFEIHIVKQNFEEVFGPDAAPQSRDIVYFPFYPNRLWEVKSSTPHRDFMMQIAYWKVDLMTYKSKADTYASDHITKMLDEITTDSYEAFAEELEKDTKDIVKPQQYDRHIGTNLKDPIRKYINQDLKIYAQHIKNHATVVAEYYYDLSSIHSPAKNNIAIQYAINSNFNKSDDFGFSCWFKNTKPKFTIPEDPVKIKSLLADNIVNLQIQSIRKYKEGMYLQIERQGKLKFYGKIVNVINDNLYDIEVPQDIITYLNNINTNWITAPGWMAKRCFENIYIDGIAGIGSPEEIKGWRISSFADRFFIANINGIETYFCTPNDIGNDWTGMFFNFSAMFGQMNFSLWKIKETRHQTTELDVVFTNTVNDILTEDKSCNLEYSIPASNILLTNIRVYNGIVEQNKQSLILNQNIIQDSHQLVIADNAYPILQLPYTGNTK